MFFLERVVFLRRKSPRQGCTTQKTELGMQIHPNPFKSKSESIKIHSKSMTIYWNPLKSIDLGIIWSKIAPLRLDPLPWLWVRLKVTCQVALYACAFAPSRRGCVLAGRHRGNDGCWNEAGGAGGGGGHVVKWPQRETPNRGNIWIWTWF